jgi:hypothetical protein
MRLRLLLGLFAAGMASMWLATAALAHGDHDARPLARGLEAGPYEISLWQVYPDSGSSITPHLIVLFDGGAPVTAKVGVVVTVNSSRVEVRHSTTTANGWETVGGVAPGDVLAVTISDGSQAWDLDPVVVPAALTSPLPMRELIYASIVLTAGTALWAATRTARAWRRPAVSPG